MDENLKCPECGCEEIGRGHFSGDGSLYQDKTFARGSTVRAHVCSNCGHILKLRVDDPSLFKTKS